jgi:hypothetical protein
MAQAATDAAPILTAPAHCPLYPACNPASIAPGHALAATPVSLPGPLLSPNKFAVGRQATRLSQIRTRVSRGPPAPARI